MDVYFKDSLTTNSLTEKTNSNENFAPYIKLKQINQVFQGEMRKEESTEVSELERVENS